MSTADLFDDLVGRLDQAMLVVTVANGADRDGCLVGFHAQCSIEPRRYLVMLSVENRTFHLASHATVLGVHVLGVDQLELARHFGELTADDGIDKLAGRPWSEIDGVPVLDEPPAAFTGRILDRVVVGDHTAHVVEPLTVVRTEVSQVLGFQAVKDLDAGHPA